MRISATLFLLLSSQVPETEMSVDPPEIAAHFPVDATVNEISRQIEQLRNLRAPFEQVANLLALRGHSLLQHHRTLELARVDFEEALELDPANFSARHGLALFYQRTAQQERPDADLDYALWVSSLAKCLRFVGIKTRRPQVFGAWLCVAVIWCLTCVLNIRIGLPAMKQADASFWRLAWVSACVGIIAMLPIVIAATFVTGGVVSLNQWRVAGLCGLFGQLFASAYLCPPLRIIGATRELPSITDEDFLTRIRVIAGKMKTVMPVMRLWPSISGAQNAYAFVGTLHAPQIFVTDGILNRLLPEERDAIVAHELGHVANGSLWMLMTITPVSAAVLTAATELLPVATAIPFGLAFLVGFKRLVSRPVEFNCDYRAARAVGFRTTFSALAKIHAANPIADSGLLSMLAYATATHPSRSARLSALYHAAPEDDRPDRVPDAVLVRASERTAMAVLWVWLLVMAGTIASTMLERDDTWLLNPLLWTVAVSPMALLVLAVRKQASITRRRLGRRFRFLTLFGIALTVFVVLVAVSGLVAITAVHFLGTDFPPTSFTITFVIATVAIGIAFWSRWTAATRKLQLQVGSAIQVHDFKQVLELCARSPQIVQKSHLIRYNLALSEAICGSRETAVQSLRQLWKDKPRFPLTALFLGELLLDANRPEEALEIASDVRQQLPKDIAIPILEARALRRAGRLAEARQAYQRAMSLDCNNGNVQALAAALELDSGNPIKAMELVDHALELAPGDCYNLIVRAEITLKLKDSEKAADAVDDAIRTVHRNPLVFLTAEVARLESLRPEKIENVRVPVNDSRAPLENPRSSEAMAIDDHDSNPIADGGNSA